MQHKYTVRFARDDPETPGTMDEQIALARVAARRLGIPNFESGFQWYETTIFIGIGLLSVAFSFWCVRRRLS